MAESHILIYAPWIEGGDLMNLRHVAKGLMDLNHSLTLAIDGRTDEVQRILHKEDPDLLANTHQLNAYAANGKFRGGSEPNAIRKLLLESGADTVFVNMLDTFISSTLRRAALGIDPPAELKGTLGGHYSRLKWFAPEYAGPNSWLKRRGFARLSAAGWFGSLLVPNEYDTADLQQAFPETHFVFMPEPGQKPVVSRAEARRHFNLPDDAIVLLNYGVGHRRKGLHLVTEAMRRVDSPRLFLLTAGRHTKNQSARDEARKLEKQGRALVLDRYITEDEEAMCFRGCDFVLTPYLSHYGSSNVLALAVRAGRPVLSSDFHLIGRRVRERNLGILFRDRSVYDLETKLRDLSTCSGDPVAPFAESLAAYAGELTVEAFHASVQTAFPNPLT